MHKPLRQYLLRSSAVLLGVLTLHLAPLRPNPADPFQAATALAETPATPLTPLPPSPCPVPTAYTAPSPLNRVITVEDWKVSFQVPSNYRTLRSGKIIQIFSPESFVHFQCRRSHRLTDDDIPTGITLNLVEGNATETIVRSQATAAAGSYLGETKIDSGTAFVHTSHVFWYTLHLSAPTPDQQNTIVFSTILSNAGEIFYEETFDIIRGTFAFSDR